MLMGAYIHTHTNIINVCVSLYIQTHAELTTSVHTERCMHTYSVHMCVCVYVCACVCAFACVPLALTYTHRTYICTELPALLLLNSPCNHRSDSTYIRTARSFPSCCHQYRVSLTTDWLKDTRNTRTYACRSACTPTGAGMSARLHVHRDTHTSLRARSTHTYTYRHMFTCTYIHMYIYTYIHIYIYTKKYIHIYIYTYTHIHI